MPPSCQGRKAEENTQNHCDTVLAQRNDSRTMTRHQQISAFLLPSFSWFCFVFCFVISLILFHCLLLLFLYYLFNLIQVYAVISFLILKTSTQLIHFEAAFFQTDLKQRISKGFKNVRDSLLLHPIVLSVQSFHYHSVTFHCGFFSLSVTQKFLISKYTFLLFY